MKGNKKMTKVKKTKLQSLVFSADFCRQRIGTVIPNPEGISDLLALSVATQLEVLPTVNIGTYTPEKKDEGIYCTMKGFSGFREAAFVRLSDANKPLSEALEPLQKLQESLAERQRDLASVIDVLEAKVKNS